MVARRGIEPLTPAYETGVLPLHYLAIKILNNLLDAVFSYKEMNLLQASKNGRQ